MVGNPIRPPLPSPGDLLLAVWLHALLVFAEAQPVPDSPRALHRMQADERYLFCLAYQQPAYAPADPIAEDCTWTVATHGVLGRLTKALGGDLEIWLGEFAAEQALADARYPAFAEAFPEIDDHAGPEQRAFVSSWMERPEPVLDVEATTRMLSQVVFEEARDGLPPVAGRPIQWSRRFWSRHPSIKLDRLLTTLSHGRSSFVLRTGHEEAVVGWMMARPDRSVTPEQLFRTCYREAHGDLYLALLTAENVLSRGFLDPDRQRRVQTRKLAVFIDTWDDRGDHFGAWYHLFGLTLYTYARGGFRGWVASRMESHGSHVSSGLREREPQEDYLNRLGVRLGRHLRRVVRDQTWRTHRDQPEALAFEAYARRVADPARPIEGGP